METESENYADKRKALSAAFFKSKLLAMTKIIKEVTLKEIKRLQHRASNEVDLVCMTIDLQSRIIINCSVGMGHSTTLIPYENDDGTMTEISI